MAAGTGFNAESKDVNIQSYITGYQHGRYATVDNVPEAIDPSCAEGCNYVTCKEDMTYEELCTLEGMIALFNHDKSLDKEIANLKEDCLLKTIHDLEDRVSDVLTLMFYVKSDNVPEDEVAALLNSAIDNPMCLIPYIDEADKSKYDVNLMQYVEDVEGGW